MRAPAAARRFQPGQFYRLQNFETLARARRRHAARDGRASRSPAPGSIASAASSRRSCSRWAARPTCARCSKPGEPVVLMGPTGTPTEIAARRDGRARRRRPRQRGALLDRPGVPRRRLEGALLRRLQEARSTATRSPRSRPPPTSSSGAATRRPASRRTRPQDRAFVGNIVQAMVAYAAGALGAQPIALADVRPHHRHRLRPHDGRGRRGAPRRAGAVSRSRRTSRDRRRSTRRCSA